MTYNIYNFLALVKTAENPVCYARKSHTSPRLKWSHALNDVRLTENELFNERRWTFILLIVCFVENGKKSPLFTCFALTHEMPN